MMTRFVAGLRERILRQRETRTDGELLADYVGARDRDALSTLIRRHGPLVWGVCRRLLSQETAAEDAFQNTFLILARKAATIREPEALGNWLYGVARKSALKLRSSAGKQRAREQAMTDSPEPMAAEEALWNDIRPILDEELRRLPEKYRVLIVLCDMEGLTRKAVAERLELPAGTVAGRLARGRELLAERLVRRGVMVTGGVLAGLLTAHSASACVPEALFAATLRTACLWLSKATVGGWLAAVAVVASAGLLCGSGLLFNKQPAASTSVAAIAPRAEKHSAAQPVSARPCWEQAAYVRCSACHAEPVSRPLPEIYVSTAVGAPFAPSD